MRATGKPPTARQLELLRFVRDFRAREGFSPSMREMADELGIAYTNAIVDHLDRLEDRGLVQRRRIVSRSTVLTEEGLRLLESPASPATGGGSA